MLELSSHEIVFAYSDAGLMQTTITIRNLSAVGYVTYKIKTTSPDLFEVNPSKGVLPPSANKAIEFKMNKLLPRGEAKLLVLKEKFLVQALLLQEKKKSEEIEKMWATERNSSKIENTKLKLRIDGLEGVEPLRTPEAIGRQPPGQPLQPPESFKGSRAGLSQFGSVVSSTPAQPRMLPREDPRDPPRTAAFSSMPPYDSLKPSSFTAIRSSEPHDDEQAFSKLEELKRQQVESRLTKEQLAIERDEAFRRASQNSYQTTSSSSLLPKILLFCLFFVLGIGGSKYLLKHYSRQADRPSPEQSKETVRDIVRDQRLNPNQKIILQNEDSSEVILTNDDTVPIRLSVRTAQMQDGSTKLIIS